MRWQVPILCLGVAALLYVGAYLVIHQQQDFPADAYGPSRSLGVQHFDTCSIGLSTRYKGAGLADLDLWVSVHPREGQRETFPFYPFTDRVEAWLVSATGQPWGPPDAVWFHETLTDGYVFDVSFTTDGGFAAGLTLEGVGKPDPGSRLVIRVKGRRAQETSTWTLD